MGWLGLAWVDCLAWPELAWLGLGLAWPWLVFVNWASLAVRGLAWVALAWAGLGWLGLGWHGLAWLGLGRPALRSLKSKKRKKKK